MKKNIQIYSFFPGCSLKTSASENLQSLYELAEIVDLKLVEIDDWNCCGSSSAHCVDEELALSLAGRIIFLAPANIPLVVACPSCNIRIKQAWLILKNNKEKREKYEKRWNREFNTNLEILHLFDVLDKINFKENFKEFSSSLKGLKFAPYYGCMLAKPIELSDGKSFHGIIERILACFGAEPLIWSHQTKCCGTYLSVAKPEAITPAVNNIVSGAKKTGADCIITACAMCHLNLEIRCNLPNQIPSLHLTEILSVALGTKSYKKWFKKHLVDPGPLLKSKRLI